MLNTEMLARVRTLLDEASAGFFTDAEIYSALTDGQKQVANFLLSKFQNYQKLPEPLRPLLVNPVASSGTSINVPADYWHDFSLKYGSSVGAKQVAIKRELKDIAQVEDNSYLTDFYYTIDSDTINFGISGTQYYTLIYLKKPTAIDGSTQPILSESSHSAIVHWATAQMFIKDQKIPESQVMMKNYMEELQVIA
jgi:hypothetical protein